MADYADADILHAKKRFTSRLKQGNPSGNELRMLELDSAALEEFGFTFTELRDFWGAARAIATEESPACCRISRAAFEHRMQVRLAWCSDKIKRLVDDLSIGERDDFLRPPLPFKPQDVYPWRFTRAYSYVRRPFLIVNGTDGPDIVIGHRHLHQALLYLGHLCLDGRLEAKSPSMKKLMSRLAGEDSEAFNDRVAAELEKIGSLIVRSRVKRAGSLRGSLAPPGDIDVLVACRKKRIIYLLECKDLSLARTPREWANELDALFRGTGGRKSTVEKHMARRKWAETNLPALLKWLELGWSDKWHVIAAIVLDRRPMSAHLLTACPLPVMSVAEVVQIIRGGQN